MSWIERSYILGDGFTMVAKKSNKSAKKVSFALQGGGAHGAFTWGVLDRLLEGDFFEVEGVCGTSAGGINAVAVSQGIVKGGNEGARQEMHRLWKTISDSGKKSALKRGFVDKLLGKFTMNHSPAYIGFDFMSRIFSPSQLNPMNKNPFRDLVNEFFDFEALRKTKKVKAFVCATSVKTGKLKIFETSELRTESILASACLPMLFQAVEIDGEHYWDGGYIGNPPLYPLIYNCETPDIITIKLNPTYLEEVPSTSREILDRLNEITCNATLIREMRMINFLSKLIDDGSVVPGKLKRLHMHLIENEEVFKDLNFSSKLNTDWDFLIHLFEEGRKAGDKWMDENYARVGIESTADIEKDFVS